ncbi:MAG: acylphosphatase [Candidatus Latescibacterota bacterium]
MSMATLHVWIEGKVQGVYFRDFTRSRARDLGLTGWVRNLADGRVEAVFQGERSICEEALAYVHMGPSAARVTKVDHRWVCGDESFASFEVR